jgi:hydroxymethylglutaryl-CoA reductase
MSLEDRKKALADACEIDVADLTAASICGLDEDTADKMVENVIGLYCLPFAVAVNFVINGREVLVPMVTEEPSVVAAASHAAKLVREAGGFYAQSDPPMLAAQVQLLDVDDVEKAIDAITEARAELSELANASLLSLVARGGGTRSLRVRALGEPADRMLVVDVLIDVRDAMGANLVNVAAEAIAPRLAALAGARVGFRILSNLCDRRCVRVSCNVPFSVLTRGEVSGEQVAGRIVEGSRFAELDPYRAATHNKGIFNGVDAVVLATGNDFRAVEAAGHAFACRDGHYQPLSIFRPKEGVLQGQLEMPLAVGIVGGTLRIHPTARLALAIAKPQSGPDLAMIAACAGLATNLAALYTLATDGIIAGHMKQHARSVAVAAGAVGDVVEIVARQMVERGAIHLETAREILATLDGR